LRRSLRPLIRRSSNTALSRDDLLVQFS
jgi:hypothetical protein